MTKVTAEGVELADGAVIPSELVVWAAGVKGPDVLAHLDGLEVSRSNQLVVGQTLQTTRDDNIFAMGDCAYLVQPGESHPVPRARRPRIQEASSRAPDPPAPQGRAAAAVRLPRLRLAGVLGRVLDRGQPDGVHLGAQHDGGGWFARLMYRSLYKMHLMALHGPLKVALDTVARTLTRPHRAALQAAPRRP